MGIEVLPSFIGEYTIFIMPYPGAKNYIVYFAKGGRVI